MEVRIRELNSLGEIIAEETMRLNTGDSIYSYANRLRIFTNDGREIEHTGKIFHIAIVAD